MTTGQLGDHAKQAAERYVSGFDCDDPFIENTMLHAFAQGFIEGADFGEDETIKRVGTSPDVGRLVRHAIFAGITGGIGVGLGVATVIHLVVAICRSAP